MDTWLPLVNAIGDIATLATALITAFTALGSRRRDKEPPNQQDV